MTRRGLGKMQNVTEEERRRRIEAIKESARVTDEMRERGRVRREKVLEEFEQALERLATSR